MSAWLSFSARWVRYGAAAVAAVSALLYVLSGTVGTIRLSFSLAMAGVFAAVALLLFFSGQLRVWLALAVLDLGAIIGYFAVAGTRDPHFEVWGITIKAVQLVLLAGLAYLILRGRRAAGHR